MSGIISNAEPVTIPDIACGDSGMMGWTFPSFFVSNDDFYEPERQI